MIALGFIAAGLLSGGFTFGFALAVHLQRRRWVAELLRSAAYRRSYTSGGACGCCGHLVCDCAPDIPRGAA
jgi:hypothetical protein